MRRPPPRLRTERGPEALRIRPTLRRGAAAALLAALAACAPPGANGPGGLAPEASTAPAPSADSAAVASYYAQLQKRMLARGLLRTDTGGPDAPYDARLLARNFMTIALFDEYAPGAGPDDGHPTPDRLRRWVGPVHMALQFGATVPADEQARDTAFVTQYAARLSSLTGLPINVGTEPGNFHVLVLNEDERRAIGPRLRQLVPGIDARTVHTIDTMPLSTYCLVFGFSPPGSYIDTQAVAIIRAEHPELMRDACYEEELAQGLGPSNDSPEARPSIFNDDQEFAYLTTQDALILRMLYDPRLRPGMTAAEAGPIVRQLAVDYMNGRGGGS